MTFPRGRFTSFSRLRCTMRLEPWTSMTHGGTEVSTRKKTRAGDQQSATMSQDCSETTREECRDGVTRSDETEGLRPVN